MRKYKKRFLGFAGAYKRALFLSCLFLVFGCILGSVFAYCAQMDRLSETYNSINLIFPNGGNIIIDRFSIFKDAFLYSFLSLLFVLVCSYSVYLIPFLYIKLISEGIKIGFSSGVIVKLFGIKGFIFSGVSTLMQNVLFIPALVFAVVYSTALAIYRRKNRIKKLTNNVKGKVKLFFCVIIIALVCGATEGYFIPGVTIKLM